MLVNRLIFPYKSNYKSNHSSCGFVLLHAHEAVAAGNSRKMSKRDLLEVYFEKSTLKGTKIILAVFWIFYQFGGS